MIDKRMRVRPPTIARDRCYHCGATVSHDYARLCAPCYELKASLLAHLEPYSMLRGDLDGMTPEDIAAVEEGGAPIRYTPTNEEMPF